MAEASFQPPTRPRRAFRRPGFSFGGVVASLGLTGDGARMRLFFIVVVLMEFGLWLLHGGERDISASAETGSGSPIAITLWAVVYVTAFIGLARNHKRAFKLSRICAPLLIFIGFIAFSAAWADQPLVAARRSAEFLGFSSLAFYIAMRLDIRKYVGALAMAITVSAILSVLLIIFFPSIGFQFSALAGFFDNKNGLGPAMLIGIISVSCSMEHAKGKLRTIKFALLTLFVLLLIGSDNGSGYITGLILLIVTAALMHSRRVRSPKLVLICVVVLTVVAFLSTLLDFGLDDLLGLFGRDSTLTGRTELWQAIGEAMQDRPIFGYGYASFWGLDGPAARLVYSVIAWTPQTSHNGFIEVDLAAGVIGEGLLIFFLGSTLWRSWKYFWLSDSAISAWPLLTSLYVVLQNLAGATFIGIGNSIDLLILIAAFTFATQATQSSEKSVLEIKRKGAEKYLRRPRSRALKAQ